MELSASWEAANCAATQEIPGVLWNPNIHVGLIEADITYSFVTLIDKELAG
jgi:hypothetical protein